MVRREPLGRLEKTSWPALYRAGRPNQSALSAAAGLQYPTGFPKFLPASRASARPLYASGPYRRPRR